SLCSFSVLTITPSMLPARCDADTPRIRSSTASIEAVSGLNALTASRAVASDGGTHYFTLPAQKRVGTSRFSITLGCKSHRSTHVRHARRRKRRHIVDQIVEAEREQIVC